MRTVFADTNYWIAILNPRDDLHQKATSVSRSLGQVRIITSEMIFVELLNDFAKRGTQFRESAGECIRNLKRDPNTKIYPQTSIQFAEALSLYSERKDKEWSLTDCASILIMQKENIGEILSYDKHFQQAGFSTLLRD